MAETAPGEIIRYEAHPPMFRYNRLGFALFLLLMPVAIAIVILMVWYLSSRARKLTITDRELRFEQGLRANASRCSHAELDEATELNDGNPAELGEEYHALLRRQPQINVLGGFCGRDHRYVEAICGATRLAA